MKMIYAMEDMPLRLQSDKLVVEELPNELMVYDPARNKAFCLNQTAAFVWRRADGKTTVRELAVLMGQHLNQPINERMVWYALDVLSKDGLLAPATVLPEVPVRVARHALLQGRLDGDCSPGERSASFTGEKACLELAEGVG